MSQRRKILEHFENSPWRERAQRDIARYRMGDARITLVGPDGKPIQSAKIKAVQKKHEFKFGANLFMLDEMESQEKNDAYKEWFAETFNMATLPFYWCDLEPERGKPRYAADSPKIYRRPATDLCVEFCKAHGIEPREHALAYDHFFPEWLSGAPVEEVKAALENRFREIAERYAGDIPTIEVTNEMRWGEGKTSFYAEPDYVEWCFKTARKYFPNNKLSINECFGIDDFGRTTDQYYAYTEANILRGAPIDAIGFQCHGFYKPEEEYERSKNRYNPDKLYRCLDLYARLGKTLQVTEITIPAFSDDPEDEQIQAELLENMYTLWFSHPNMEQIIYWNLVDGYAYTPAKTVEEIRETQGDMTQGENVFYGGLLRFDMTPKPAYQKLHELIHRVWHTEESICTDEAGRAAFRGFYGDYELTVEVDGEAVTRKITVSSGGENCFQLQL